MTDDQLIPVRLSHLTGQSGVGAIVRGPNGLVVVQDTRQWTDRHGAFPGRLIPYVERVRAALSLRQELREPPIAKENPNNQVTGSCVPVTRFPSWTRCPGCGTLYSRPWMQKPPVLDCVHCRQQRGSSRSLEQIPWALVHSDGHLGDVPWSFLAHRDAKNPAQTNCKVRDSLRLVERGYEERTLSCGACGATSRFRGNERLPFGHGQMQPWTKNNHVQAADASAEQSLAQVLAINDTRAYSPIAESVLVIPPESRVRRGTVVDSLYRNSGDRLRIDSARTPLARKGVMKELATQYRCEVNDIDGALSDLARGYPLYGENLTPGQLRESEFAAFLEILSDQSPDEDLVTQDHSGEWRELANMEGLSSQVKNGVLGIRRLVRVERLKAVKVFLGFTRLDAETIIPPDIIGSSDWLPAVELYGEGLFIALDERKLRDWEQNPVVLNRLDRLMPRFTHSGRDSPNPLTARFMLLHTLSHLLMRQIESEGGYPAASLSERLYCASAPEPMAGILIHLVVPDIAGSMGGLADLAEPKRFLGTLTRALECAQWCSLDPVCSEHEGQGPGLLNRAACHACALVPEPACEYGNILLDRAFVKGDRADGLPSFFE